MSLPHINKIIHIYGTPWAPNWNRSELLEILADDNAIGSLESDSISPLGKPEDPKQNIVYSGAMQQSDNTKMLFTIMNDTAHVHIDKITFSGRKVDMQLLMFTWFDYFQYEPIKLEANHVAKQAQESNIPLGLIVDVTTPKQYHLLTGAIMRDGKFAGSTSMGISIPIEIVRHCKKPVAEDISIFLDILGLDCQWGMIDRDQPREDTRAVIDDLIGRCASE